MCIRDRCVCVRARARALRIVSMDKILRFKNIIIIIIIYTYCVKAYSLNDSLCLVLLQGSVTVLKKLVRSKPTVSRRSGLFTDSSCSSGFQTFLTDSKEYARWLHTHSITLPPPLQLHPESDEEVEEVEEEEIEDEEVEEVEEEEVEYDGK